MKKIVLLLIMVTLLTGCFVANKDEDSNNPVSNTITLFEYEDYKDIVLSEIDNIEYIRYTVAGDNRTTYTDDENIKNTYEALKNIKLGEETEMVCEDNTTVYVIHMKNGDKYSVEIECDWVIIGKKRYLIAK